MADEPWPWPDEMDGVLAAPRSHRVLIDNDSVRVLEVTIGPGLAEPEHTHRRPSVMIVDGPARIRYYAHGVLEFESPPGEPAGQTKASWMPPEGPHSVENIDSKPYHAIRVELKHPA
jgi:predicted metal-dependent enzyme (double-stranded beta helix superfamily)